MTDLILKKTPQMENVQMVIGFSGWMNGGNASIGTVDYLIKKLRALKFAELKPDPYYIYNFPGPMEMADEFRPLVRIAKGVLEKFSFPKNEFYFDEKNHLILFKGKEPNIHWEKYAQSFFEINKKYPLKRIVFIGSVASSTPHTRGVSVSCYCSSRKAKKDLGKYGIKYNHYEGPGSISTLFTLVAKRKGIEMINLVAEIPVYIQSENPKAIKTISDKLIRILNLNMNTLDLNKKNITFEKKINELLQSQPRLADEIRKLEENYDEAFFDDMGGFEEWLKRKGINKL